MTPIAAQPLNHNVDASRLERYAVVAVVDDGVLYNNVARVERVPAVRVMGLPADADIVKDYVLRVAHEVEPLRRVPEPQITDDAAA
jgi:hypothetical protein